MISEQFVLNWETRLSEAVWTVTAAGDLNVVSLVMITAAN